MVERFESFINIFSLSCCRIYKERSKKRSKTVSKANTQSPCEYYSVHTRIIFILCFVYMSIHRESKSCLLLSMSMMSTSNFEVWE